MNIAAVLPLYFVLVQMAIGTNVQKTKQAIASKAAQAKYEASIQKNQVPDGRGKNIDIGQEEMGEIGIPAEMGSTRRQLKKKPPSPPNNSSPGSNTPPSSSSTRAYPSSCTEYQWNLDKYDKCTKCSNKYPFGTNPDAFGRCLIQKGVIKVSAASSEASPTLVLSTIFTLLTLYNSVGDSVTSNGPRQGAPVAAFSFTEHQRAQLKEAFGDDGQTAPLKRVKEVLLSLGLDKNDVEKITKDEKTDVDIDDFVNILSKAISDKGIGKKLSEMFTNKDKQKKKVVSVKKLIPALCTLLKEHQAKAVEELVTGKDADGDGGLNENELVALRDELVNPCACVRMPDDGDFGNQIE